MGAKENGYYIYDEGAQRNVSATPNNKYEFDSWDDGNTNLQRTIIVNELKTTYVAKFINTSLELVKIINGYVSLKKRNQYCRWWLYSLSI